MTMPHMLTCVIVAFGPHYLVYRFSKISETKGALKSLPIITAVQLCAQLFKMSMIVMLPFSDTSNSIFLNEATKLPLGVIDVLTIYLCLQMKLLTGLDRVSKVLAIGVGWSFVDSVISNGFSFLVGARGMDFDWKYFYRALSCSVNLMTSMTIAYHISGVDNPSHNIVTRLGDIAMASFAWILVLLLFSTAERHGYDSMMSILTLVHAIALGTLIMEMRIGTPALRLFCNKQTT